MGSMVGATDGAGVGSAGVDADVGAAVGWTGPGLDVGDGPALATAAWLPCGATGSWSPPRAATNETAIAAHATVNSADAITAGVSVRRAAWRVEPFTPLLCQSAAFGSAAGC